MSDGGITLFALHFDGDVQIGPRRLGTRVEDALPTGSDGEETPPARTDGGRSRPSGLAAAGALVGLAVAAAAAWRHVRPR